MVKHTKAKRMRACLIAALCAFIIVYLAGATHDAAIRYQRALAISKSKAHTVLGKEGYEYIFDPDTHILVDKILPNDALILTHIMLTDYLGLDLVSGCTTLDSEICQWIQFNVLYYHDPRSEILNLIYYAAGAAVVVGIGIWLYSSSTTWKRHMYS
jgi:hypothetical protein